MKHQLELILDALPYDVRTEYKFHPKRKFRLDYCIFLNDKPVLGIEYNGLNPNANKSRHSSFTGIIRDMEKLNLALECGIPILQYNFRALEEPGAVLSQIMQVIRNLIGENES